MGMLCNLCADLLCMFVLRVRREGEREQGWGRTRRREGERESSERLSKCGEEGSG